uniref:GTP cyclohydrolase II n=1 Tax=Corethron hystrix TaxID=216773 RepID=A0A7S1G170_9STRA|mmetsp:Transcript_5573/g.11607  ORF Transcript_5573/g.11607 Transcript_5573/m.11607 type:complete len:669 (+) Transcript_5573:292-2298(+)
MNTLYSPKNTSKTKMDLCSHPARSEREPATYRSIPSVTRRRPSSRRRKLAVVATRVTPAASLPWTLPCMGVLACTFVLVLGITSALVSSSGTVRNFGDIAPASSATFPKRIVRLPFFAPNGSWGQNGITAGLESRTCLHGSRRVSLPPLPRGGSLEPVDPSITLSATASIHHEALIEPDVDTAESGADAALHTAFVAETSLPTDLGLFRLRAYRITNPEIIDNPHIGREPCVIYSAKDGPQSGHDVPIRIHDQCFTSEVFGSLRCDCKEQLEMSFKYIQENGGLVIYLQQEGRGIGLANKVAAYALQDMGLDTVDANLHLGFPDDCRQYGVIPGLLNDLGIKSIRLMTNNPRKVERLRSLGINVSGNIPMVVPKATEYNRKYLETKINRMNHTNFGNTLADEMLVTKVASTVLQTEEIEAHKNGLMSPRPGGVVAAVATSIGTSIEDLEGAYAFADTGYCFGRQSVEDAIAAIGRGELVVVVDDMDRENEGDFIAAADLVSPEAIATMVRYTSGVLCVAMESDRMDELQIPNMVKENEDPKGTAFGVSVDATTEHGITTGISAADRARTLNLLGSPKTTHCDFVRPGHIFPLRAREGGTLTRNGHTEATVDLSRLAGCHPSGVLCEIVSEDNPTEMMRLPEMRRFCKEKGFVLTSIADIQQFRRETEQ